MELVKALDAIKRASVAVSEAMAHLGHEEDDDGLIEDALARLDQCSEILDGATENLEAMHG